mmetsp:Transcript_131564/g.328142  ORF Transcript_131564/g.328142 Transcript_131564/m.328142 type:complete len:127 (-) Transcript_131564:91-471(-)|eukprot:CAMPEP_0115212942 /NCGR_PEP_ID=MMETSP0270-20121206/23542_1 /TAXON_ID=71861 /ORGANISM="Scrippsiella trochoidea, Strain CCMP3099" /LENGTH=126 /DNA_ID=CAMNT_0002626683 /DNA_START=112 /DNA_END=492 /DNA_ORIENTATION=+
MAGRGAPPALPPGVVIYPSPPKPLLLFITNVKSARTIWVEISINDNVLMLKKYVERKMNIPVGDMILIYMGEELKNEYRIKDCKLDRVIQKIAAREDPHSDDCTIHLIDLKDTPTELREPAPAPPA